MLSNHLDFCILPSETDCAGLGLSDLLGNNLAIGDESAKSFGGGNQFLPVVADGLGLAFRWQLAALIIIFRRQPAAEWLKNGPNKHRLDRRFRSA